MAKAIHHAHVKIHRKADRLRTIAEAIGGIIIATETAHITVAVFFISWAALDVHEIFWSHS